MDNEQEFVAALRNSHSNRSGGMGSFTVPAWCQFIALVCFAFAARSIRGGMLAGVLLMVGSIAVGIWQGSVSHEGPVLMTFTAGFTLLFLPLIKAGELKMRLSALGVLDEFMAQLFADHPAARWLKAKFGKPLAEAQPDQRK